MLRQLLHRILYSHAPANQLTLLHSGVYLRMSFVQVRILHSLFLKMCLRKLLTCFLQSISTLEVMSVPRKDGTNVLPVRKGLQKKDFRAEIEWKNCRSYR